MRVLVYGMQSGGVTAFTLFLAQRPDCLALVDVPNNYAAPRIDTPLDMVVKVVVTTAYPIAVHRERFRPDRTILLLRDPHDTYQSLKSKDYRHRSGLMEEKFVLMDRTFADRHSFDAVIRYEDFVARDPAVLETIVRLGWPVTADGYTFARRHEEIIGDLRRHVPDLFERMEIVFGNVQGRAVDEKYRDKYRAEPRDPAVEARLRELCPDLLAYYRKNPQEHAACTDPVMQPLSPPADGRAGTTPCGTSAPPPPSPGSPGAGTAGRSPWTSGSTR